jgi:hypothetical protein
MATNLVNLDALIPREDFEVVDDAADHQKIERIQIRDLEKSFFYNALRKPDFQRETANWSPEKIQDFVRTFLNGDLIPAIILWRSGKNIFVIDGAHRLSALIAWVQNDYGEGTASREFFENVIPPEQQAAADATSRLIKNSIGTYEEHVKALSFPQSRPEVLERAQRLASLALQLQWVTGDSKKAEAAFFKINQEATPIDATELRILQSRNSPNAMAARAVIRSGTGHKYWQNFVEEIQNEIEDLGKEINDILFTPALKTPIKTLDVPVAGRGYSAKTLPLIFDLVNLANDARVAAPKGKTKPVEPTDHNGTETLKFLKNTRRVVFRISGTHPSSLGLHPVVYFYSLAGRYQPTSFLAVAGLVKELEKGGKLNGFTKVRRTFEDFLLQYKTLPNQVTVKLGSGVKGFDRLKNLYALVIDRMIAGDSEDSILEAIRADNRFYFLSFDSAGAPLRRGRKDMDTETKSETFLKEALASPLRCKICSGLIHYNSITIDHIVRKADGGVGVVENAQLTHPYCNSTFKN